MARRISLSYETDPAPLGDEERSLNVIHASASQFEAARDYAAMLPHLMSRGADRPLYLPAGHLTEEPEHDFTASCDQLGPELEKWREAGLLVERRRLAWTQGPGEMGSEPLDLTHTSMASGLRAARAAIREADIDGPLIVTVKVSEEALWEFSGLHEEGDRYEGLQAGVSPWASDVSVVISTEYLVDGRPMRIQFAHGLGFVEVAQDRGAGSTSRRDAYALSMVSRFAADNDMEIMFDEHTVLEIDDSYRVAPWEDPARPESLPVLSEQQLFGSDACAHRNSRWEQNDLEAWLVCDDCFNGAVARVPTHRIPASSLLTREIADEKAYLNARRYWDVVNGRPPEIVGSVADLRDREPPVSMIAADYATGLVAAAARRRPASVREAMNRR